MKRLISNAKPIADIFFSDEATIESIFVWIQGRVFFGEGNIFKLNEQYSCILKLGETVNTIIISGDEDYVELTLEDITPIF